MAALTPVANPAGRSAKAEQTRRSIVTSALGLFREHGYDATTMRSIADAAGVSLGNAYYYFAGKEHLIQAFYDQVGTEHELAVEAVLGGPTEFVQRLTGVLDSWVDVAAPYHEFAAQFFKTAADPNSPMSPFSEESAPARRRSIELYARLVDGSDLKLPKALRGELPELLWLLQMGVVLFWVYDGSEGQARTRTLIRAAAPMIDKLIRLSRIPGVRGVVEDLIGVIRLLREDPAPKG